MRRIWLAGVGILALGMVSACDDENPIGVGSELLGDGVQTYEVIFEAHEFLVMDTTFDQIGSLNDAGYRMVAHEFEGELDARTLVSVRRPQTVTYTPAEGSAVTDSIAAVVGGTLTLIVDTIATTAGPIDLELYQVTEEWHGQTATWTTRVDTAGVTESWTVPGGSPGALVGSATWESGDTLRITMDSAAIAVWDDSTAARLGGVLRTTTPGVRLFVDALTFQFDVLPVGADTVVQAGSVIESKIIVTPEPTTPEAGVLRVGGLPTWRTLMHFRPMDELRIPCAPGSPPGCAPIPLVGVTVNTAAVLLDPLPAGSRRPERAMRIEGRGVWASPGIPVTRSPLTPPLGLPTDSLAPDLFVSNDPDQERIRVPVTNFIRFQFSPPAGTEPPQWLALTAVSERTRFGYATFGGMASARPPQLRLVVSVPDQAWMP